MQEQDWMAHLDAYKTEGISLKAYAMRFRRINFQKTSSNAV